MTHRPQQQPAQPARQGPDLTAAIVIACYTEQRWEQLAAAVTSALGQDTPADAVVVSVDHNEPLRARVARTWPSVVVVANAYGPGASGARNTGVEQVTSPVVAFLDDDAVADPSWLSTLVREFCDPTVVGVGGSVDAAWETGHPSWFPDEFAWVVGASYPGQPTTTAQVRNVWAENMAVRRDRFLTVGGFRLNFGKVGTHSSPEDTDLCIRMAHEHGRWLHVPAATVAHHVPAHRSTFSYFVRRCYHEGEGKAALAVMSADGTLETEQGYTRTILPRAFARGLADAFRQRQLSPAVRSASIMVGLGAAGAGFAQELLRHKTWARRAGSPPQPPDPSSSHRSEPPDRAVADLAAPRVPVH